MRMCEEVEVTPYHCELCPESFSQLYDLLIHIEKHNKDVETTTKKRDGGNRTEICKASDDNNKTHEGGLEKEEFPYKCKICGTCKRDAQVLQKHIDDEHPREESEQNSRDDSGELITQTNADNDDLEKVEKEVDDVLEEFPYKCQICSESLPNSTDLECHITSQHLSGDSSSYSSGEISADIAVTEGEEARSDCSTEHERKDSQAYPCICQLCGLGMNDCLELEVHLTYQHPSVHPPGVDQMPC